MVVEDDPRENDSLLPSNSSTATTSSSPALSGGRFNDSKGEQQDNRTDHTTPSKKEDQATIMCDTSLLYKLIDERIRNTIHDSENLQNHHQESPVTIDELQIITSRLNNACEEIKALKDEVETLKNWQYEEMVSSRNVSSAGREESGGLGNNDEKTFKLSQDTFSLMKISSICSFSWLFAIFVFIIQIVLFAMIFAQQSRGLFRPREIQIPLTVDSFTFIGQLMAIVVTVALSKDLFIPIREIASLWITNLQQHGELLEVLVDINEEQSNIKEQWLSQIVLPNVLQFL